MSDASRADRRNAELAEENARLRRRVAVAEDAIEDMRHRVFAHAAMPTEIPAYASDYDHGRAAMRRAMVDDFLLALDGQWGQAMDRARTFRTTQPHGTDRAPDTERSEDV